MQYKSLGEAIRCIRIKKELSKTELADLCGVYRSTLCNWEYNANKPLPKSLKKLSDVLEYNFEELEAKIEEDKRTKYLKLQMFYQLLEECFKEDSDDLAKIIKGYVAMSLENKDKIMKLLELVFGIYFMENIEDIDDFEEIEGTGDFEDLD